MIRINGGRFKGKNIFTPNTELTRVTTAYSKKVIFDTLHTSLDGAIILDLFAGSGSLGIEALSRGAKKIYFVDHGSLSIKAIKKNIQILDIAGSSEIINTDYLKFINTHHHLDVDIIFLDPPYSLEIKKLANLLIQIVDQKILNKDGNIVLEIDTRNTTTLLEQINHKYTINKLKKRGNTTLIFIKPVCN